MTWFLEEDRGRQPITLGEGRCLRETERAILVLCGVGPHEGRQVWLPKSVLHDESEVVGELDRGEIVVARWFAEKEGLA